MATRVFVQNNTAYQFAVGHELIQRERYPLPSGSYRWNVDCIKAGQHVELLRFNRSSGPRRGAEYVFESRLSLGGDQIALRQKMRGSLLNSHLWQSLGGHEWFEDREWHDATWQTALEEIGIQYRAYFTGGDDDIAYVLNHGLWHSTSPENTFNVLAYNIFMRPRLIFRDGQRKRLELLCARLPGCDAIVFSEVFDDGIRERLLELTRHEYPHVTCVLGEDEGLEQDGGVIIVSKWPIEKKRQRAFGDACSGWDCRAKKGVLYACLEKSGKRFHLFGCHAQAGDEEDEKMARTEQFRIVKRFIDEQEIPAGETVVIAGDFNVNSANGDQFQEMLGIFDASYPEPLGYSFTVDPVINGLSGAGRQEYLDYVLYSNSHLRPERATVQTRILRSQTPWRQFFWRTPSWELSDHFPVLGRLEFGDVAVE